MQASSEHLFDQGQVGIGWGADVDDVDIAACQQVTDLRGMLCDTERGGGRGRLAAIEVANGDHLKVFGNLCVGFEMSFTDTQTNDRDAKLFRHLMSPTRTAMASAFSASSVARKQCSCVMAVSVLLSTSWIRRGP